MIERELRHPEPLDLGRTHKLISAGRFDPTGRATAQAMLRATRTPEGPATLGIEPKEPGRLVARAWGPGAEWVLARAHEWIGAADRVPEGFLEAHPELLPYAKRSRGVRLARPRRVVEHLMLLVLQQLVTGKESKRAHARLVRYASEPAPGPFPDLWLPVAPEALRNLSPALLPPLGIVPRMGEILRRVGQHAERLEEVAELPAEAALGRMLAIRGIGPWTANLVALGSLGHPDAVAVGDYHLPNNVAFHLAGEERADDARMLELLEPYAGQRGRVVRWITSGGRKAPRRGPRLPIRDLPEDADRWLRPRRTPGGPRA